MFGLATDAKARYHVIYEDDDEEEMHVEDVLECLVDEAKKQRIKNAVRDMQHLMNEKKNRQRSVMNFYFHLRNAVMNFLVPRLRNGDKFVQIFTTIVCFLITLSRVDATMV